MIAPRRVGPLVAQGRPPVVTVRHAGRPDLRYKGRAQGEKGARPEPDAQCETALFRSWSASDAERRSRGVPTAVWYPTEGGRTVVDASMRFVRLAVVLVVLGLAAVVAGAASTGAAGANGKGPSAEAGQAQGAGARSGDDHHRERRELRGLRPREPGGDLLPGGTATAPGRRRRSRPSTRACSASRGPTPRSWRRPVDRPARRNARDLPTGVQGRARLRRHDQGARGRGRQRSRA